MNKNEYIVRYTRGSGPGGQHKNKVETCAVITHKSTGIQVRCQDTRSKNQNLKIGLEKLSKKVENHYDVIRNEKKHNDHKERVKNAKTIRTYNFKTKTVYDHRTKVKKDLKRVMNGELDF